jgi:hypothetical protein
MQNPFVDWLASGTFWESYRRSVLVLLPLIFPLTYVSKHGQGMQAPLWVHALLAMIFALFFGYRVAKRNKEQTNRESTE